MTGGRLHILQAGAVVQCRGDERSAHGVCGVATLQTDPFGVLPENTVNNIRVQVPACVLVFAVFPDGSEQRPVHIILAYTQDFCKNER